MLDEIGADPLASLGATCDGRGTRFALYSSHADGVRLVLPGPGGDRDEIILSQGGEHVWSGYVRGVGPGQRYGYRVAGAWKPELGLRHDQSKILLDPYAKAVERKGGLGGRQLFGVVIDGAHDWKGDLPVHLRQRPLVSAERRIVYETHLRSFTKLLPEIPSEIRGTFAGMAHPLVVDYLVRRRVTSLELMPLAVFLEPGWGYGPVNFFALQPEYAHATEPQAQLHEFKDMVRTYHEAGIEIVVDHVYNHTGEGNELGPTHSFRGIDNSTYYGLVPGNPSRYWDATGCGNTVNISHPVVRRLVMDSLRYWVSELHVNAIRFDLGVALMREGGKDFNPSSEFILDLPRDSVVGQAWHVFEPWDLGGIGSYQLGGFHRKSSEWNDKFRDEAKLFLKGETRGLRAISKRIRGSKDIFRDRGPLASLNYVTCHDRPGPARDLAEKEFGHLGVEVRLRQQRNMIALPLLSVGTPMIFGGDERNRTQYGNENPYDQDNEINHHDWSADDGGLPEFETRVADFRLANLVFLRTTHLKGRRSGGRPDYLTFAPDGVEMQDHELDEWHRRSFGLLLDGDAVGEQWPDGTEKRGDSLLLLFHSGDWDQDWKLPEGFGDWEVAIDTALPEEPDGARQIKAGGVVHVTNRSIVALRRIRGASELTCR